MRLDSKVWNLTLLETSWSTSTEYQHQLSYLPGGTLRLNSYVGRAHDEDSTQEIVVENLLWHDSAPAGLFSHFFNVGSATTHSYIFSFATDLSQEERKEWVNWLRQVIHVDLRSWLRADFLEKNFWFGQSFDALSGIKKEWSAVDDRMVFIDQEQQIILPIRDEVHSKEYFGLCLSEQGLAQLFYKPIIEISGGGIESALTSRKTREVICYSGVAGKRNFFRLQGPVGSVLAETVNRDFYVDLGFWENESEIKQQLEMVQETMRAAVIKNISELDFCIGKHNVSVKLEQDYLRAFTARLQVPPYLEWEFEEYVRQLKVQDLEDESVQILYSRVEQDSQIWDVREITGGKLNEPDVVRQVRGTAIEIIFSEFEGQHVNIVAEHSKKNFPKEVRPIFCALNLSDFRNLSYPNYEISAASYWSDDIY